MTADRIPFLVVYDQGKIGALWGVMVAGVEDEITTRYPELAVIRDRPKWMTVERYAELAGTPYDIDGAPWGLLNVLLANRERE